MKMLNNTDTILFFILDAILLFFQAYWEWSWDELVAYDLPATFQYVHDQTGQKIHYVGHSLVNSTDSAVLFCFCSGTSFYSKDTILMELLLLFFCRELW